MDKTYIYEPNGSNDALIASMMNGGGMGAFNNPFWAIILLAFLRNGFGWNGNEGSVNGGFVASQLGQAIAGNANAINNLSTHLDCTVGQIQCAVNGVQSAIANLSSQTGMGQMQIINAINAGDAGVINQMQSCCCDLKTLVTNLNYEGRLADQAQTAFIGGKIDAQTTLINDKFCQLELRGLQDKLDQERAKSAALTNQLSQEHQNATFAAMLAPLAKDIEEIKCKQPTTATIPYSPVVGIPSCVAYQYGLNALAGAYPFANGGQFG